MSGSSTSAVRLGAIFDPKAWCTHCGTNHGSDEACPWPLDVTGPEQCLWRQTIAAPHGREAVGVLVAPVGPRFRARIVTYPKMLWAIPGGRVVMKFLGDTAAQAGMAARAFVETRLGISEMVPPDIPLNSRPGAEQDIVIVGPVDDDDASDPSRIVRGSVDVSEAVEQIRDRRDPESPVIASPRKAHRLSAQWGTMRPSHVADTGNVSDSGLFLVTMSPIDPGARIVVRLQLGPLSMPLKGRVVWHRGRLESGLPPGMGVCLVRPPAVYVDYVNRLP